MHKKGLLIAVAVLLARISGAQQTNAPFWQTPGTTIRDAKGNITYTEVKDRKTFTMKVFDHGHWLTYHYQPNTAKVLTIDAPDTVENYLYDGDEWNGLVVHAAGRAHTIHVSEGTVTADNMPAVTIERDEQGRDIAVRRGAEVVAVISYDAGGQVKNVRVGAMSLDFSVQKDGILETLSANGTVLSKTVGNPETRRPLPVSVSLDPVVERLGISSDWRNSVRVQRSVTGSRLSITNVHSDPIAEMVQLGAMSAAFDPKGLPLFYDLSLRYTPRVTSITSGDAAANVTTGLNGILPNHLIVPITGDASAYVQAPGDNAISSIWTVSNGSSPSYRFRIYHESPNTQGTRFSISSCGADEFFIHCAGDEP